MGEARRRRLADQAAVAGWRSPSGLTWEQIEQLAAEDPGDRQDRQAHGIPYEADWRDPEQVCRNGCGLPYAEIVAGKIRGCTGGRGDERDG